MDTDDLFLHKPFTPVCNFITALLFYAMTDEDVSRLTRERPLIAIFGELRRVIMKW